MIKTIVVVQSLIVSDSLQPQGLQHTRLPCPSLSQTHVHGVGDAIQPSHPLLPSLAPALNLFHHQGLFQSQLFASGGQSFSISPSNEYSGLICFRMTDLILWSKGLPRVFFSPTMRKQQFFGTQPSLWSNSHIRIQLLENP